MRDLLEQLALPRPAVAVYFAVLTSGPLSATDVARVSGESGADLENAIRVLAVMRLIGNDRGKIYSADPAFAWLAIVADLVWGKQSTLSGIRALPSLSDTNAEATRRICEEIGVLASDHYKPYSAVRQHRELDARNFDELSFLTCEIINRAQSEIVTVSKSPRLQQLSSFWAVLTDRIDNHGVRYRRIADLDEVEAHGLNIVRRDMVVHHIDLRILERDSIAHEFYVIDGKYAAIKHSEGSNYPGVGRVTNYLDVVDRYSERFRKYLSTSIPANFVVEKLDRAAQDLMRRAEGEMPASWLPWIADIVAFGKFSKFHEVNGWSSEQLKEVERIAVAKRIVRRNAFQELVPCYGVTEAHLREEYRATDAGTSIGALVADNGATSYRRSHVRRKR